MLVWGWSAVISYFVFGYLEDIKAFGYWWGQLKHYTGILIPIFVLLYTAYAIYEHRLSLKDQINRTVIILWSLVILFMIFVNVFLFHSHGSVPFETQQPVFMVLTALVSFATGRLKKIGLMMVGSVVFLLLGIWAFQVDFTTQKLLHSIGWFVTFVIPGHIGKRSV